MSCSGQGYSSELAKRAENLLRKLGIFGALPEVRDPKDFEIIYNYPPGPALQKTDIAQLSDDLHVGVTDVRGLYVHIPYCGCDCSYCHYTRRKVDSPDDVREYLGHLLSELDLWSESIGVHVLSHVSTVYFGGGTPTILRHPEIQRIHDGLNKYLDFSKLVEYTWESSPDTIRGVELGILRRCGVNRISIGIQSMNAEVLAKCSRGHNVQDAIIAYQAVRNAGYDNVNIDLIYGFPDEIQSTKEWEESLRSVQESFVTNPPESISIHQLRLKPGTQMYSECGNLPSDSIRQLQLAMAHIALGDAGYTPIEAEIFVRDPTRHRHHHQQDKWSKCAQHLGLGLASYGYLGVEHLSYFNHRQLTEYYRAIDSGLLPVERSRTLGVPDRRERMMVLGLTFFEGVSKEQWKSEFGEDEIMGHPECLHYREIINDLMKRGLLEETSRGINLTMAGGFHSREIRQLFFGIQHKQKRQYFDDFQV